MWSSKLTCSMYVPYELKIKKKSLLHILTIFTKMNDWNRFRSSDFSFPSVSGSLTFSPFLVFPPNISLFFFLFSLLHFEALFSAKFTSGSRQSSQSGPEALKWAHAWRIFSPVRGQCRAPSAFIPTLLRKEHIFSCVSFSFSPGLLKISLVCGEKMFPRLSNSWHG